MITISTPTFCMFTYPGPDGDILVKVNGENLVYDTDGNLISGTVTRIRYFEPVDGGETLTWDFKDFSLPVNVLAANNPAWFEPDGKADLLSAGSGMTLVANTGPGYMGGPGDDTIVLATDNSGYLYGNDGNDILVGSKIGSNQLEGGAGNDILIGGAANDVIFAGDGDDTVKGGAGNDSIDLGTGAFHVRAGDGSDTVYAGDGGGRIYGEGGDDLVFGGLGRETIEGGEGNDTLIGGGSINSAYDGTVPHAGDLINGGAGNDVIIGLEGDDALYGGEGDDFIGSVGGTDFFKGDAGADTFAFYRTGAEIGASGLDPSHTVTILDFDADEDFLYTDGTLGQTAQENYDDFMGNATQVGNNVVYDSGDGVIVTLRDVDLTDLTVDNFVDTTGSAVGTGGF